ncbi:hypothetical protein AB0F11_13920 [Streptomyces sp. NPDC032472]
MNQAGRGYTMQADGSNGFHMDTDFANPDHAAQQHRRRRGIR